MPEILSDRVARQLADHLCRRITKRTISGLQRIAATLSGDDSKLRNAWDEICVQVQAELSVFWHVYGTTMTVFLTDEIQQLQQFERDAIWLQTEPGTDWDSDDNSNKSPEPPTYNPDIIGYILREYLLPAAENWTNGRIRAYLDRYG